MEKDTLERQVTRLENDNKRLREELELEKTWQEGEIDWWRQQCNDLEEQLMYAQMLINKPKKKAWWRHIIS